MSVRAAAAWRCAACLLGVGLGALACRSPESTGVDAGKQADAAANATTDDDKAAARDRIRSRLADDGLVNKNQLDLPPLPDIIATVAGHEIPRREFEVRYAPSAQAILARRDDGRVPGPFQATQRRDVIAQLIWSKQLELEAQRSGVDVTPEALAQAEADERRHVLDWDAWLARVGQTQEIRHQANVDHLRERALLEARVGSLDASEDELRAAYEQAAAKLIAPEELVRASHLLITYGPRVGDEKIQPLTHEQREAASDAQMAEWKAQALARAQALREASMAPGVDFHAFAKEWSEGPGAFRGGDMGLFPRKQMVPEYSAVAFALAAGETSEPVESEKGYYVIRSFGRYPAGPLPYEAVRDDLVRQVEAEKWKAAHAALQAELGERFPATSAPLDEAKAFLAN